MWKFNELLPLGGHAGISRIIFIADAFLMLVQADRNGGGLLADRLVDQRELAGVTIGLVIATLFLASEEVQFPVGSPSGQRLCAKVDVRSQFGGNL